MALNTEHLSRCLLTLENGLDKLNQSDAGSIDYEVYRNAVVKGFELTLETAGKLIIKALKPKFANPKTVEKMTFKDVLRSAAEYDLLTLEQVERWFRYRDNRNTTAHDYGEGFAEDTLVLMPDFISDVKNLIDRLHHADA